MPDQVTAAQVQGTVRCLERRIQSYRAVRAVIAFSGGVDSAVVLALAARALGTSAVTAVTAVSPSYPAGELAQAREVARSLGVEHRTVETGEVKTEGYARNDAMRCFHCKTELYTVLRRLIPSEDSGERVFLAGANADDAGDFRPGLLASRQHAVRNPLLEERIGKSMIRATARLLGITVAEKPALACLSSRVAYGIRVTPALLGRIDQAEQAVRSLGFSSVRVRHFGELATIEVPRSEVPRLLADSGLPELLIRLRSLGWRQITVDRNGLRTGSMNVSLEVSPALKRAMARVVNVSGGKIRSAAGLDPRSWQDD